MINGTENSNEFDDYIVVLTNSSSKISDNSFFIEILKSDLIAAINSSFMPDS